MMQVFCLFVCLFFFGLRLFASDILTPFMQVSFPSLNSELSHSFPLISLANECASNVGFCLVDRLNDEAGNYFSLATIWSSSKV